jgi:uncharacterized membrane protein
MDERNQSKPPNAPDPATAKVLAEVERRMAAARRSASETRPPAVILAGRFVSWLSKHWLAVCNTFSFLYVGLPVLAPVLMRLGAKGPATIIHLIYRPLCHQLPQRSLFLFGPQFTYTLPELMQWLGPGAGLTPATAAFAGNETVGYKMALCQRDVAIYGAILLAGLLSGLLRRRWKITSLPWWAYVGFGILPMLLDGGYQFLSYVVPLFWPDGPITPHETTPALRLITGALFGLATVWLSYPLLQETMDDFRRTNDQRTA